MAKNDEGMLLICYQFLINHRATLLVFYLPAGCRLVHFHCYEMPRRHILYRLSIMKNEEKIEIVQTCNFLFSLGSKL